LVSITCPIKSSSPIVIISACMKYCKYASLRDEIRLKFSTK
jgi:hypothetical protein